VGQRPIFIGLLVPTLAATPHFAVFFFALQVLGGLLLLFGFFVPLAGAAC
jgi:hypothetical protein